MGGAASTEDRTISRVIASPNSAPEVSTRPTPQQPAGTSESPGKWQVEDDERRWSDLPTTISDRIEEAHREGRDGCNVVQAGRMTTVSLSAGSPRQYTVAGSRPRALRRVDAPTASVPNDPFALDNLVATSLFQPSTARGEGECHGPYSVTLNSVIYAHEAPVFAECFAPEGDRILTGAKDGSLKYWEVSSSFLHMAFEHVPASILSVSLSKIAPVAATGTDDCKARLYSLSRVEPRAQLEGHTHKVYGVSFTRDGRNLVSVSMDSTLRLWDVNKAQHIRTVHCHSSSIFSAAVSPASSWLAITASDDTTMAAHDFRIPGDAVTARFRGHTKTLWGCDIRFDDGQFISCGMDNQVCLWDPRVPDRPTHTISSHNNPIHCVEYMPDGQHFLSSSRDRSFKISDTVAGNTCLSQEAHEGHVFRVTYNAVANTLMTCGADACVKLWNVKRE